MILLDRKKLISFTCITAVIGFMLAVQFQTIKRPVVRDTRDMWQLRADLAKQQQLEAQLIKEISGYEEKINKYETEKRNSKETVLNETLQELNRKAGLTEVSGQGLIITVEPFSEIMLGEEIQSISPELLKRLINELNRFEAQEISVANQRVVNTTVIRDINGVTKIDGYPLNIYPIEIKVIAKDAERLYNRLKVSSIIDDFVIENLIAKISSPIPKITIPAYEGPIRINNMKPVQAEKGE